MLPFSADAPHQAALDVPPGAEILQVDVVDRQHHRSGLEVRAHLEDGLRPAPVGAAQERERGAGQPVVPVPEVRFDQLAPQPLAQACS